MIHITSFSNPKFKYLKSLAKAKNRRRDKLFIMEGREELDLAIKTGLTPKTVAFCDTYISEKDVLQIHADSTIEILQLSKPIFDDLAYQCVPNNYIAIFPTWETGFDQLSVEPITVILEGLEKPGNLGAILRTCSAAGVRNIIVAESDIDLFNPNVIRNSRGAVFNTNVVFTTNDRALNFLQTERIECNVTALSSDSVDYRNIANDKRNAFVFGSESKGVSAFWIENASALIKIPMHGELDSLNLSVSVGVVLYSQII